MHLQSCDPNGYLIQTTNLFRVNITSGNTTLVRTPVGPGGGINAMGYNVVDNFLYAAVTTSGVSGSIQALLRIDGQGNYDIINNLNNSQSFNSGDVDENAQWWGTASGNYWMQVDLLPGSPTYGRTVASGTAPGPAYPIIDWAYVPGGGDNLYGIGYGSNSGQTAFFGTLQSFNRTAKTWTTLTSFGPVAGKDQYGAVYASDDGSLFGSENNSGMIYKFPLPQNGTVPTFVAQGPKATSNDGARCAKAAI